MSEDSRDRDKILNILRKDFILRCVSGGKNFWGNKEATPIPINLFQITSCIVHEAPSFTQQLNLALMSAKWKKKNKKQKKEHLYSHSLKILHICDEDESCISFWGTTNKNIFSIFPPPVHQNKVASVLPSPEAHAIPHHLFLCSQQAKALANPAV